MNSYILLSICLTIHLIGLTLMAGTILIDGLLYRVFWRQLKTVPDSALQLLTTMASVRRVAGIGAGLLIITGVGMMAVTDGVFGEQIWFRVKFGLVIGVLALTWRASRWELTLRTAVAYSDTQSLATIERMKRFLTRYFLSAFLLFFLIILVSVFKFN